jgi:hypothetical protein
MSEMLNIATGLGIDENIVHAMANMSAYDAVPGAPAAVPGTSGVTASRDMASWNLGSLRAACSATSIPFNFLMGRLALVPARPGGAAIVANDPATRQAVFTLVNTMRADIDASAARFAAAAAGGAGPGGAGVVGGAAAADAGARAQQETELRHLRSLLVSLFPRTFS